MFSRHPTAGIFTLTLMCLSMFLSVGCHREEPIVTYVIPTTVPAQLRQGSERMLAAMVPLGQKIWFFKLTGPEAAIELVDDKFRQFVTEISFSKEEPDLSALPEGWQLAGEKPMRFASIDIPTPEKQLDLSISNLPRGENWDEQVLANVNRWRGQLSLAPSTETWAGAEAIEVAAAEGKSVWVDIIGTPGAAPSMSAPPPFASKTSPPGPAPTMQEPRGSAPMADSASEEADSMLKGFEKPDSWREGNRTSMRLAAFNAGPEDAAAELTVIPAGGDLRGNVARWMGQIRPSGVSDAEVDEAFAAVQEIEVDGRSSQRFLLVGEDADSGTAIDATIIPLEGGMSLFVKMTGPVQTVRAESESIAAFLNSMKL